jgi:flagellar capping protein FliD
VLDDLTDEQVALDERIAASEERHTAKFTTMSKIVDEMNSLQEYLKSQLDNLPFTKKES